MSILRSESWPRKSANAASSKGLAGWRCPCRPTASRRTPSCCSRSTRSSSPCRIAAPVSFQTSVIASFSTSLVPGSAACARRKARVHIIRSECFEPGSVAKIPRHAVPRPEGLVDDIPGLELSSEIARRLVNMAIERHALFSRRERHQPFGPALVPGERMPAYGSLCLRREGEDGISLLRREYIRLRPQFPELHRVVGGEDPGIAPVERRLPRAG